MKHSLKPRGKPSTDHYSNWQIKQRDQRLFFYLGFNFVHNCYLSVSCHIWSHKAHRWSLTLFQSPGQHRQATLPTACIGTRLDHHGVSTIHNKATRNCIPCHRRIHKHCASLNVRHHRRSFSNLKDSFMFVCESAEVHTLCFLTSKEDVVSSDNSILFDNVQRQPGDRNAGRDSTVWYWLQNESSGSFGELKHREQELHSCWKCQLLLGGVF